MQFSFAEIEGRLWFRGHEKHGNAQLSGNAVELCSKLRAGKSKAGGIAAAVEVDFWGSRWRSLLYWSSPNLDILLVCSGPHSNCFAGQTYCASPRGLAFAVILILINPIFSSLPGR